jgi:hypothetical protein
MNRMIAALLAIGLAIPLTGCVVTGPGYHGGGWCYWHPYRCR